MNQEATTTDATIDTLEAERARLALDAAEGVPGAAKELQTVEQRLRAAAVDAERAELATAERARRKEAAERAEVERLRAEARAQFARLGAEWVTTAEDVDRTLAKIIEALSRFVDLGRRMRAAGAIAGIEFDPGTRTRTVGLRVIGAVNRLYGNMLAATPWAPDESAADGTRRTVATFVVQERAR